MRVPIKEIRYITCFTCGKKGHKSVDCPEKKVNRIIVKPSVLLPTLISGKVGKMGLDITLDTGTDISTVHSKFVQPFEYLGRHISVSTVGGTKLSMPLAQVWIHIEDYSIHLTVAVDTKDREDVLLGRDVGPVLYDSLT